MALGACGLDGERGGAEEEAAEEDEGERTHLR